jgi:hypothetical protein
MIPSSAFLSWDQAIDVARMTEKIRLKIAYRYFMRISSDELGYTPYKLWKTVFGQLWEAIFRKGKRNQFYAWC